MKLMVMAAGTGGHIFPGLAVADCFRQLGGEVVWLGTPSGMERELVAARGYRVVTIDARGLRGKGWLQRLRAPWLLLKALSQALNRMRLERPAAVLGMGGFVCGPGGVAARLLRIPLVLHEQNSVAGLTNRLLAGWATRIFAAFPGTFKAGLPVEVCGNPVRAQLEGLAEPARRFALAHAPARLLVLGGSLGAEALNRLVPEALANSVVGDAVQVIHQCGRGRSAAVQRDYDSRGLKAEASDFIEDMAQVYGWADCVVCRSGAVTVAELAAVGLAAILVPFPYAVDDHQTGNARYLRDGGAAILLQQADLEANSTLLRDALEALLDDPRRRLQMAEAARRLAHAGAARRVAEFCRSIAE